MLGETEDYSDATVEVVETGDKTITQRSGFFTIELPPGSYTLNIYKDGYSKETKSIQLKAGNPLDLGGVFLERVGPVLPSKTNILSVGGVSGDGTPGVDWDRLESLITDIEGKPVSVTRIKSLADLPPFGYLKKYWVVYLGWNWGTAGDRPVSVPADRVSGFLDYIKQGGRVVTAATDDATSIKGFLPYNIAIIDAGDHNATITDEGRKSRLFESLDSVDLNGMVLDDVWNNWSAEYVLFALRADNPAQADILFAKYGNGIVLLTTLDARADSQYSAAMKLIKECDNLGYDIWGQEIKDRRMFPLLI